MTKKELLARIEQLERRVRDLEARPHVVPASPPLIIPNVWPPSWPGDPFAPPYKVTCAAQ